MKILRSDQADLFVDGDILRERGVDEGNARYEVEKRLGQAFHGNPEFREYCDLFAQRPGFRRRDAKPYAILFTHAANPDGYIALEDGEIEHINELFYKDGEQGESVQEWIDAHDGKYGTLVFLACNGLIDTPSSRRSLLWVPAGEVIVSEFNRGNYSYDLIHPNKKIGLITSYIIEHELAKLKESSEKSQTKQKREA